VDGSSAVWRKKGIRINRVRVEHNRDTLLVHISGEDGHGWTTLAIDRATREWATAQRRRQVDAATVALGQPYR
jgi:hypothetical protein